MAEECFEMTPFNDAERVLSRFERDLSSYKVVLTSWKAFRSWMDRCDVRVLQGKLMISALIQPGETYQFPSDFPVHHTELSCGSCPAQLSRASTFFLSHRRFFQIDVH